MKRLTTTAVAAALICAGNASGQEAAPVFDPELRSLLETAAASETPGDLEVVARLLAQTYGAPAIIDVVESFDPGAAERLSDTLNPPNPVVAAAEAPAAAAPESGSAPEASDDNARSRLAALAAAPAAVGDQIMRARSDLWDGRATLGLRFDSGNANRRDYAVGLEISRALAGWGFEAAADYAFSEVDDRVGRDEFNLKARAERELGEAFTAFINTDYEQDALSGFDHNAFLGGGVGYRVYEREGLTWTLRAGPGVRILTPEGGATFIRPASDFTSDFAAQLTDTLSLELDSHLLVSDNSRAEQTAKLVTALGELWAFEIRYRYRYEFDPEPGFENSDQRADVSIVREF